MSQSQDFEFRPASDNEMAEFRRISAYVFASPPQSDAAPSPIQPQWTQCAFAGPDMAAISGGFPFIVRLNGNTVPVQGVTSVGTDPRFRRRGLVRRLITDLLHRAKEEDQAASMLLASMGAIYQRFGYGLSSWNTSYRFDPRLAQFEQEVAITGECKIMGKDEALSFAKGIFKAYVARRTLMALRPDVVWDGIFDRVTKGEGYCAVHFADNGEADGYCIYSTSWNNMPRAEHVRPPQEMVIHDLSYTNMNGYRALWEFIRAHDLVGAVTWIDVPEDDPAPGLLLEPRCLNRKTIDGVWFRVVDVPRLLAARAYDVDGSVTIGIEGDDLCPWNNGNWSLGVHNGRAVVEDAGNTEPDFACSINALASLASGFASASWLHRMGRLDANNGVRLGNIDALFATHHRPSLSFGF